MERGPGLPAPLPGIHTAHYTRYFRLRQEKPLKNFGFFCPLFALPAPFGLPAQAPACFFVLPGQGHGRPGCFFLPAAFRFRPYGVSLVFMLQNRYNNFSIFCRANSIRKGGDKPCPTCDACLWQASTTCATWAATPRPAVRRPSAGCGAPTCWGRCPTWTSPPSLRPACAPSSTCAGPTNACACRAPF